MGYDEVEVVQNSKTDKTKEDEKQTTKRSIELEVEALRILPNPVVADQTLSIGFTKAVTMIKLEFYDSNYRKVKEVELSEIDSDEVRTQAPSDTGLYFLRITNEEISEFRRIVVVK